MTAKEQADKLYNDAYNRWCYEISHEKNVLTAKDIAMYMCDLVLSLMDTQQPYDKSWWMEVREEIRKK